MKKYLVFLIGFGLSVFHSYANEPMSILVDVEGHDDRTVTLPLQGTVAVTVSWGDGEESRFSAAGNYHHIYASIGSYVISISGELSQFGNGEEGYPNAGKLREVLSFGDIGLTSLSGAFKDAIKLDKVPNNLPPTVTALDYAFSGAVNINLNVRDWDVSNVTDMTKMFEQALSLDQDLSDWRVGSVTHMDGMFSGVKLSTDNYSNLLMGWASQSLQTGVTFDGGLSRFYYGEASQARQYLMDAFGWTIIDGGLSDLPTVVTLPVVSTTYASAICAGEVIYEGANDVTSRGLVWATHSKPTLNSYLGITTSGGGMGQFTDTLAVLNANSKYYVRAYAISGANVRYGEVVSFTTPNVPSQAMVLEVNTNLSSSNEVALPLFGTVDVTVNWGDGKVETFTQSGMVEHTYADKREYIVAISGSLTQFGSGFSSESPSAPGLLNIQSITSLGQIGLQSLAGAFQGVDNLTQLPQTLPGTVKNLEGTFAHNPNFNIDISSWDVSNVTNMSHLFYGAQSFNQEIGSWDVDGVVDMESMFEGAQSFNGQIGLWDVSNVTNMSHLFYGAQSFNQEIGSWDVGGVVDMESMFEGAQSFNGQIGLWDVSNVTNMERMFKWASSFNQDLSGWCVYRIPTQPLDFDSDASAWELPRPVWATCPAPYDADAFVTTWNIAKNGYKLTFPVGVSQDESWVYDYYINWGDGSAPVHITNDTPPTHTYQRAAQYPISVTGSLPWFSHYKVTSVDENGFEKRDSIGEPHRLIACENFGDVGFKTAKYMFSGTSINKIPTQLTGFDEVKDMSYMFSNAKKFNQDIGGWDVSSITDMSYMFASAFVFNQDIGGWDVSNVTDMGNMFEFAGSFNQDIGGWDVGNVLNMVNMFRAAKLFNQDIGGWDVGSVTDMSYMFASAFVFNQDIGGWDVSGVTDMMGMFFYASEFNQDIGNWDVGNVVRMYQMFENTKTFNQDIGRWDVSNVITTTSMFSNAIAFNQDIGGWDMSSVIRTGSMFLGARAFNQDIGNWDMSNVTDMGSMFSGALSFNQDIGNWDVSNVTDMRDMFRKASAFNQDISGWNVSNVEKMNDFLNSSGFSTANYNKLLEKWSLLPLQNGVVFGAASVSYSPGEPAQARQHIIDEFGWTINDKGLSNLPVIATLPITDITFCSATSGGELLYPAGDAIIQSGVVWSLTPNPTIENNQGYTIDTLSQNTFVSHLTDLTQSKNCYVRAYAINSYGISYGNEICFPVPTKIDVIGQIIVERKVYDGTTIATLNNEHTHVEFIKNVGGPPWETLGVYIEDIYVEYKSKVVSHNSDVNCSIILGGPQAHKYCINLLGVGVTSYGILPKIVDPTGHVTFKDKEYDGINDFEVLEDSLQVIGFIEGDDVNLIWDSYLQSQHIGEVPILVKLSLTGEDSDNYGLSQSEYHTSASIFPREVTISGSLVVDDKIYNGDEYTYIQCDNLIVENTIPKDGVEIEGGIGQFSQKEAADNLPVMIDELFLHFSSCSNCYFLNLEGAPTTTASIFPKPIGVSGSFSVFDKVYDATTIAQVKEEHLTVDTLCINDEVFATIIDAEFLQTDVGSKLPVDVVAVEIQGADKGNYTLSTWDIEQTVADILPKTLHIGGSFTPLNKVYDAKLNAQMEQQNLNLIGVIGNDDVTIENPWVNFVQSEVGEDIPVEIGGLTLGGLSKHNYDYVLDDSPQSVASITPRELTVGGLFSVRSRAYNGTTEAEIFQKHLIINELITGDDVVLTNIQAQFEQAQVGNDIPVSLYGLTLSGLDHENYSLNVSNAPMAFANITPRCIDIEGSFTVDDKEYDGKDVATLAENNLELVGLVDGDEVGLGTIKPYFSSVNTGFDIPVYLNQPVLSGVDKANYILSPNELPSTAAAIYPKELYLSGYFTAKDKVYDGGFEAQIHQNLLILQGAVYGDNVNLSNCGARFNQANVGDDILILLDGLTLSGSQKDNYFLSLDDAPTATASITPRGLGVGGSFTVYDKVYDGTQAAQLNQNYLTLPELVEGDQVDLVNVNAQFVQSTVGTDIDVELFGLAVDGIDVGNYTFNPMDLPTAQADIVPKEIGVGGSFTVKDKVYDGTQYAQLHDNNLLLIGVLDNEDVMLSQVGAQFMQATAGTQVDVELIVLDIDGNHAHNYTLALVDLPVSQADILPKELFIGGTFSVLDKEYDGTPATQIHANNLALIGLIVNDNVIISHVDAQFVQPNAAENIEVELSNPIIAGNDVENYTLNLINLPSSSATIFPKELTIGGWFTVFDKEYDGTTHAEIDENNLTLLVTIDGDNVCLTNVTAQFDQEEVGDDILVQLVAAEIGGMQKNNYLLSLAGAPTTTGNIIKPNKVEGEDFEFIVAYPNPFISHIYFQSDKPIQRVVITATNGQVLMDFSGEEMERVDVSTLKSGLYIITVEMTGGINKKFKMVKQ